MVDTETYIDTEEQQPDPQPKPKKLSVKDFATKIKQKYPDYKDIDDKVLTDKIIAKYPVYKDQVELTPNVKKRTFGQHFKSIFGWRLKWYNIYDSNSG